MSSNVKKVNLTVELTIIMNKIQSTIAMIIFLKLVFTINNFLINSRFNCVMDRIKEN